MKVNFLSIALKLCVIVMFCGFGMNLYAVNVKTAEAAEYIDLGDGEKFSSMKIPVIRNRLRSEARNSSVNILKRMETYYLQVIISKLKNGPNEKHSKISDEEDEAAQKILNSMIEHAYIWGMEYR